jgi:hypothetical protein
MTALLTSGVLIASPLFFLALIAGELAGRL